jgi:hypothetical protein
MRHEKIRPNHDDAGRGCFSRYMLWIYRLGWRAAYALAAKAGAVMTETPVWIIVLCPLILILLACLVFGGTVVSGAFEALFRGIAWIVAVWVAVLEAV